MKLALTGIRAGVRASSLEPRYEALTKRSMESTGPGTKSSSVRRSIFWNGRKMSLLAELVSYRTRNSTYMPALTGFRLCALGDSLANGGLGASQSGRNQTDQAKIKPNLTLFKPKKWQRHLSSIKNFAFIYVHPPSAVLLQRTGLWLKPSNPIKGYLMKKIPNFFPGTLTGKHW